MKPFNLDEYLTNPSKKVITRNGRAVKIHCTNYTGNQPIIAQMEDCEYSTSFTEKGKYCNNKDIESQYDLFFASEKHEGWLNVYRDGNGITSFGAILHTSREEAEEVGRADDYYAATAKIEWEE